MCNARRETTLGFSKRNEAEASSMRLSSHDRGKLCGADGIENDEPPTSLGHVHSRYVADAPNAESHRFVEFAQMKGPGKKSVRLSQQPASTDPATAVCPPLTEYTSVTELEEVDLFVNPWHMIRGEISEPFELKEVHHCGEILMEDEDGACMTVRVRIRCVPSSKEGRLVPGVECSVKGYVRQRFDSEFELEARWGDVVFENDSFSEPDNDDQGDFVLGPHYSAVELKKLDARRRIRIQGDVVRPFEEVGNKYEGIVKVKNVGTQCVRVCFDWIAIEEEPQDFILQIRKGVEVEVMGWAERRGAAVFMDALLIEILEDAPMENRRASWGQGTPASGSAAHMSFAFDSLKGDASIQEYDDSGSSSPRDPYVSNGDQGLLQHDDYSSDDRHALGTAGLGSALSLAPIKFPSRGLNKDDTPSSCEAAPKSARSSRKPPRARKIPPHPSPKKLRSKTVETKTSTDTEGTPVLTGDGGQNNKGIGPIRQGTGHEATFEQSREESLSLEQSPDTAHVKPSSHDLQRVKEKDKRKRKSSSDEPALPVDCENQKEPADLSSNAALKPVSRKGWSKGK
ncbi:hypothetical protein AAVH_27229 [Aphelenchoides avenae]|nr:hypothetical protein AAVH_27229 [Aphelenchus avenae]